ncbi:MAG: hypothetical protein EBT09_02625 [Actinobacteria bacterium]|nr:hypothetical protein [Actinomycetota bacterium]
MPSWILHLVAAHASTSSHAANKQTGLTHNVATTWTLTCHKVPPITQQGATPQATSMQPR